MKLFSAKQQLQLDYCTILNEPIKSIDLMERAAIGMFSAIRKHISKKQTVYILCGNGNNGGDGYALARLLQKAKYKVSLLQVDFSTKRSTDCEVNIKRCLQQKVPIIKIDSKNIGLKLKEKDVLIDSLFGIGLSRPLQGKYVELIKWCNLQQGIKIAVDIPSGLFADYHLGKEDQQVFKADYTYTFNSLKRSFCLPESACYIGKVEVIDIGLLKSYADKQESDWEMLSEKGLKKVLKKREEHSYKGNHGYSLLIAGAKGMIGAAILAAKACLRTGTGLLTVNIPACGYQVVQTAVPEAMCEVNKEEAIEEDIEVGRSTAIGIGPGLGRRIETAKVIKNLIEKTTQSLVLDADGLFVLKQEKSLLNSLSGRAIITPHSGEFDSLFGKHESRYDRIQSGLKLAKEYNIIIVLKGRFTAVIHPKGKVVLNPTGNPGMAKGGSGDVLTGIVLSLLAQGYSHIEAAELGVWLHGKAADLALKNQTEESLIAQDIVSSLPLAYKALTLNI